MKKPSSVDIYDFDHTIYDGDCSLDFYLFCIKKNPTLLRFLPGQMWHAAKFKFGQEDRTLFKSNFFVFLGGVTDVDSAVGLFWKDHFDRMKDWYMKSDHKNDVIISASPEFLLHPAFDRLKAHSLIATIMNPKTGFISGKNCRGEEKVTRFKKEFGTTPVNKAYGDSKADHPIMSLAKEAFLVKGDNSSPLTF